MHETAVGLNSVRTVMSHPCMEGPFFKFLIALYIKKEWRGKLRTPCRQFIQKESLVLEDAYTVIKVTVVICQIRRNITSATVFRMQNDPLYIVMVKSNRRLVTAKC